MNSAERVQSILLLNLALVKVGSIYNNNNSDSTYNYYNYYNYNDNYNQQ